MNNLKLGRTLGAIVIVVTLVTLVAQPLAAYRNDMTFGAKLTTSLQPTKSVPPRNCGNRTRQCTWVSVYAHGQPSPPSRQRWARAPRDGVIKKIRLIAGKKGNFRLQLARARPGQKRARIVRSGPRIFYKGQPDSVAPYVIETFDVNLRVRKGEFLAIKAKKTSMLRCRSRGARILRFQPPLKVGGRFKKAKNTSGCVLLLEAILR